MLLYAWVLRSLSREAQIQIDSKQKTEVRCDLDKVPDANKMTTKPIDAPQSADFAIGPGAIAAYTRLSYTMWYALAEFIDNSTQSRSNYENIIDDVLQGEGNPLRVEITYSRESRTIKIADNSIGMTLGDLVEALKVAQPTQDSRGRSRYGMGMKTAACWIGKDWTVTTCEWGSGEEWTATVSVDNIAAGNLSIPLTSRAVPPDEHYTVVTISNLNRVLQRRTEETIMSYLGSMYRMDIREGRLVILFNEKPVPLPDDLEFAKYESGEEVKKRFETEIGGKSVTGWFGVLSKGGRKLGGFSLFQNDRQIKGYPDAWRPRSVFGGVDEEGGNSLVSQRLVGEIVLDRFEVSHTKDAIQFHDDDEEKLEAFIITETRELKQFASSMRKKGTDSNAWDTERLKQIIDEAKAEFNSAEFKDVLRGASLPPLQVIQTANQKQVEGLDEDEILWELTDVGPGLTVRVAFQDRSENDPHLIFVPNEKGITVIINRQHPYFVDIDSAERVQEIIKQYVYDAIAEFTLMQRLSRHDTDSIRKLKDQLLRARLERLKNADAQHTEDELLRLTEMEN